MVAECRRGQDVDCQSLREIVACRPLASGPFFAFRSMHKAVWTVLNSQFAGILDVALGSRVYSIIPRFQVLLSRIMMVTKSNSHRLSK